MSHGFVIANGGFMFKPHRAFARAFVAAVLLCIASTPAALAQRDVAREPARPLRAWVRDGVIYEIFPRNFSPQGNFNGVTAQLERLKELGVTILWLMPIHITGEEKKKGTIGSPYAVRDYYSINPDYGTKDDLKRLIAESHRRGMKVIIDIVANHTSWDSVMMKTPEFYRRDQSGKILSPYDWTDVAALNYENAKLRQYMTEMLVYWVREFNLDGFRCDVAGEVPTDFWERPPAHCLNGCRSFGRLPSGDPNSRASINRSPPCVPHTRRCAKARSNGCATQTKPALSVSRGAPARKKSW